MDATKRKDAQIFFCQHTNNVLSASYGLDLSITHRCIDRDENEQLKIGIADNLFMEKDPTHFHCARHKELYDEVKGGIMYCPDCTVNKPCLPSTLLTRLCKDGKTV